MNWILRPVSPGLRNAIYLLNLSHISVGHKSFPFSHAGMKNIYLRLMIVIFIECVASKLKLPHILVGYYTLANKEYLERHNNVARYIHNEICKKYCIRTETKWHLHRLTEVYMDSRVELLWDMTLTMDREVGSNRPDIVIRDKKEKKVYIFFH